MVLYDIQLYDYGWYVGDGNGGGGVGLWPHFEMSICPMSVGYITVWLDLVQDYQIWKCELTSIIRFLFG